MSIQKRGNRWIVRWRDGQSQRGRSFRRKIDAIQFEQTILTDLRRGDYVAPSGGKVRLGDWCDEWLATAHHLVPKTRRTYRQALDRILPLIGHLPLGTLTGTDIDAALTERLRHAAPATVHQEWRTLKTALRAAVRARKIPRSPTDDATAPRVPDAEMMFLEVIELDRLIRRFDPRYQTWAEVGGLGGPRWGEMAGLEVKSVDVDRNRIHIVRQITEDGEITAPKWNSKRWVTIPPSTMAKLADHIDGKGPDELVWTMPGGGPLDHGNFLGHPGRWDVMVDGERVDWVTDAQGKDAALEIAARVGGTVRRLSPRGYFRPGAEAAGLGSWVRDDDGNPTWVGLSPHDLRHTSVAIAIAAGAHAKAIQQRCGHRSFKTTFDRYGHLFPEMDEQLGLAIEELWTGRGRHLRAV